MTSSFLVRKPVFVSIIMLLSLVVTPSASSRETTRGPTVTTARALYNGRVINLADGWEGARACAVLTATEIRCYDSEIEQWTDLARRARRMPTAQLELGTYCLNRDDLPLTLYENTSYGGTSLSLYEANTWHDLSSLGFDDMTSSWRNNTYCDATAATGTGGTGSTVTLSARSQSADVGSTWNDVISSAQINA